jgi:hypothetical protein
MLCNLVKKRRRSTERRPAMRKMLSSSLEGSMPEFSPRSHEIIYHWPWVCLACSEIARGTRSSILEPTGYPSNILADLDIFGRQVMNPSQTPKYNNDAGSTVYDRFFYRRRLANDLGRLFTLGPSEIEIIKSPGEHCLGDKGTKCSTIEVRDYGELHRAVSFRVRRVLPC